MQSSTSVCMARHLKGANMPSSLMHSASAPICRSHFLMASALKSFRSWFSAKFRKERRPSLPVSFMAPASWACVLFVPDDIFLTIYDEYFVRNELMWSLGMFRLYSISLFSIRSDFVRSLAVWRNDKYGTVRGCSTNEKWWEWWRDDYYFSPSTSLHSFPCD